MVPWTRACLILSIVGDIVTLDARFIGPLCSFPCLHSKRGWRNECEQDLRIAWDCSR